MIRIYNNNPKGTDMTSSIEHNPYGGMPEVSDEMAAQICRVAAVTIAVRDEFRAKEVCDKMTGSDHANIAIRLVALQDMKDMYVPDGMIKTGRGAKPDLAERK